MKHLFYCDSSHLVSANETTNFPYYLLFVCSLKKTEPLVLLQ